ncbi:MAG: PLDc_N domain-containing protein [Candidatus Omnitrophica bacterium]|nr:PLDc_N domain-containing protein [Candidatus Omnitrophota bacterium]
MEFLFTAFVAIFDIVAIVDILRGGLPVEKKFLWIALVFIVPVVGFMLYFLLGKTEQPAA